jgi:hypothetical protein
LPHNAAVGFSLSRPPAQVLSEKALDGVVHVDLIFLVQEAVQLS